VMGTAFRPFALAQRARWAAAIRARPAAENRFLRASLLLVPFKAETA
jgi:hypothetical protein